MKGSVVWAVLLCCCVVVPAFGQTCVGSAGGGLGEPRLFHQRGNWQADEAWDVTATGAAIEAIAGRVRVAGATGTLNRRVVPGASTALQLSAGYAQPLVRVQGYGDILCLTLGTEVMRTGDAADGVVEWSVPVTVAWGLDLLPLAAVSLLPWFEMGVYHRSVGDERTGLTAAFGVGGRERLKEAGPVHHLFFGIAL
jgi:hypothetical protein